MIEKITFEGYKGFKNSNELDIKPMTVLIGKNSSGKSAVAKLPTIIEESLSTTSKTPILHTIKGIELGAEFRDLLYGRDIQGELKFMIQNSENESINVQINNSPINNSPIITKWQYQDDVVITNIDPSKIKNVTFEGILPNDIEDLKTKFKFETNYLGPFRLNPPRNFYLHGTTEYKRIGNKGENAYQILGNSFNNNDDLVKKVGDWYFNNFDGWRLKVVKNEPYYEVKIVKDNFGSESEVNIVDVGQGMSQALPIIVKAYMKSNPSLVIIEQPELHLHPAAHGNLGELLVTSIKESKNRFLIETHSENFILRLRRMVAEKRLDVNDLVIYSVEYDLEDNCSFLKRINVDENGEVDYWPKDIFKESFEEVKALRKAQTERK
ncbi:AAA family ATPase [Flavobacterium sp. LHD-85]|uniref:AAA family ATPase n=1 Tax=Flavobacterium sp. LHD-85 TaxID=3071410 RepID=UPI0027DEFB19|nr:AAA family ATPase [Flavobacterium sp. LHD-85]MDQ6531064.1 AAA family ATPase [Flavobacterium sp. LHD-85]